MIKYKFLPHSFNTKRLSSISYFILYSLEVVAFFCCAINKRSRMSTFRCFSTCNRPYMYIAALTSKFIQLSCIAYINMRPSTISPFSLQTTFCVNKTYELNTHNIIIAAHDEFPMFVCAQDICNKCDFFHNLSSQSACFRANILSV